MPQDRKCSLNHKHMLLVMSKRMRLVIKVEHFKADTIFEHGVIKIDINGHLEFQP